MGLSWPKANMKYTVTRDGETYGFLWPGGKVLFQFFPGSAERTHRNWAASTRNQPFLPSKTG
jgi:hypothetical protein